MQYIKTAFGSVSYHTSIHCVSLIKATGNYTWEAVGVSVTRLITFQQMLRAVKFDTRVVCLA
jgi:hypothetical protein